MKDTRKKQLYRPPEYKRKAKSKSAENEPEWAVPVGLIILILAAAGFYSLFKELLTLIF